MPFRGDLGLPSLVGGGEGSDGGALLLSSCTSHMPGRTDWFLITFLNNFLSLMHHHHWI